MHIAKIKREKNTAQRTHISTKAKNIQCHKICDDFMCTPNLMTLMPFNMCIALHFMQPSFVFISIHVKLRKEEGNTSTDSIYTMVFCVRNLDVFCCTNDWRVPIWYGQKLKYFTIGSIYKNEQNSISACVFFLTFFWGILIFTFHRFDCVQLLWNVRQLAWRFCARRDFRRLIYPETNEMLSSFRIGFHLDLSCSSILFISCSQMNTILFPIGTWLQRALIKCLSLSFVRFSVAASWHRNFIQF